MTGLLGSIFGRSTSSDYTNEQPGSPVSPGAAAQRSPKIQSANPWQSVFNPGRNYSDVAQRRSKDYYDHVPAEGGGKSIWDHIVKAENLQRLSFSQLDKDGDGYLTAEDLKKHFGPAANVNSLIDAADKDKDGRISLTEFKDMMRNS